MLQEFFFSSKDICLLYGYGLNFNGTFAWNFLVLVFLMYQHRWASTSTSMSAISDIRHRHLLFRYRKNICRTENCHSNIGRIPISTSESIPISKKYLSNQQDSNPRHLFSQPLWWFMNFWMSYIGYRIKVYSDIRYNVGLRSLQSDIGSSDIKISPISLITDIGVSAHLCVSNLYTNMIKV